jgi:hypothetical protein
MLMRGVVAFAWVASVALSACHSHRPPTSAVPTNADSANNAVFAQVPLYSNEPNACTPPEPNPRWHGVLIAAPSVVAIPTGNAAITAHICGRYLIETTRLLAGNPMTLHATDKATGATFQGDVFDEDPNPIAPNPNQQPIDPASVANMSNGAAVTRDLFQFVKLPRQAATYEVYLSFGGYESNRVVIEVRAATLK